MASGKVGYEARRAQHQCRGEVCGVRSSIKEASFHPKPCVHHMDYRYAKASTIREISRESGPKRRGAVDETGRYSIVDERSRGFGGLTDQHLVTTKEARLEPAS